MRLQPRGRAASTEVYLPGAWRAALLFIGRELEPATFCVICPRFRQKNTLTLECVHRVDTAYGAKWRFQKTFLLPGCCNDRRRKKEIPAKKQKKDPSFPHYYTLFLIELLSSS